MLTVVNVTLRLRQHHCDYTQGSNSILSLSQLMLEEFDPLSQPDSPSPPDILPIARLTRAGFQQRFGSAQLPSSLDLSGNMISNSNVLQGVGVSHAEMDKSLKLIRDAAAAQNAATIAQIDALQVSISALITAQTQAATAARSQAAAQAAAALALPGLIAAAVLQLAPPPVQQPLPAVVAPSIPQPHPAPGPQQAPPLPAHLGSLGVDAAALADLNRMMAMATDPQLSVGPQPHTLAQAAASAPAVMSDDPFSAMTGALASRAPIGNEAPSLEQFTTALLTARHDHRPYKTTEELEKALATLRNAIIASPSHTADSKVAIANYTQLVVGYAHSTNVTQATLYHRAVWAAVGEGLFRLTRQTEVYYPAYNKYIHDWLTDKKIADANKARSGNTGHRSSTSVGLKGSAPQKRRALVVTTAASPAGNSADDTLHCDNHPHTTSHSTADCRLKKARNESKQ